MHSNHFWLVFTDTYLFFFASCSISLWQERLVRHTGTIEGTNSCNAAYEQAGKQFSTLWSLRDKFYCNRLKCMIIQIRGTDKPHPLSWNICARKSVQRRQAAGSIRACSWFVWSFIVRCAHMPLPASTVGAVTDSNGCQSECMCATVWKSCVCASRIQLSCIIHALACALLHSLMSQFTKKRMRLLGRGKERERERNQERECCWTFLFATRCPGQLVCHWQMFQQWHMNKELTLLLYLLKYYLPSNLKISYSNI